MELESNYHPTNDQATTSDHQSDNCPEKREHMTKHIQYLLKESLYMESYFL